MKQQSAKRNLTEKAISYLESHYLEKFSLDDIADTLFVNKNHLARVFKGSTGMTLLQYHNRLRCDHAAKLLIDTRYSIAVVAFKSGFASASHFSRIFRNIRGCTPSEYRNSSKAPHTKAAP